MDSIQITLLVLQILSLCALVYYVVKAMREMNESNKRKSEALKKFAEDIRNLGNKSE